jgi:N-acyl-D-aspartate/D-glutamate deacylase
VCQCVTTEVLGEGTSAGPYKGKLSPRQASVNGKEVSWTTLGGYLDTVEKAGVSVEDAVRKMTSLNAAKLGIADRGLLRPGQFADVTVFDAARVIDRATYTEPFQYGEGIEYVVVNGQVVLEKGKHSGAKPGRALRRGG